MGIDSCKSCGNKFGYGQLVRSYWRWKNDYRNVECRSCGRQHIIVFGSDMLAYFLLFAPALFIWIQLGAGRGIPDIYACLGVGLSIFGLSFLRPYIIRYQIETDTNKQKRTDRIMLVSILIAVGIFMVVVFFYSMKQRRNIENKIRGKINNTALR